MTKNRAKQRMLEGKPSLGTVAALGSPLAAELISRAGFDVILVDNQHGAWDDAGSALAFRSIWLGATVPMVRVPANDFGTIGRLLDRGALGIIVPLVESADEARAAAYAARYPPRGGRSWWPLQAGFYGSDYDRWIDDELFLAVQIESVRGVEHASEILAVEGVDGCWVGPTDLALSMGVNSSSPEGERALEAAIARVLEACRAVGTIPGIHCGDDAARRIDQGFLFVTTGSDTLYLERGAQETLRNLGRLRQRQGS